MFLKLSAAAREKLDEIVKRFQQGDLSEIRQVALLQLPAEARAHHWTRRNQLLAFLTTGELDCRTYEQWKEVGRIVKQKGCGYILGPIKKKIEDGADERIIVVGYNAIPVFPYSKTEQLEDFPAVYAPHYAPKSPPPLYEVAEHLGLKVTYTPLVDAYGFHTKGSISLGTHDFNTFFHELGHELHERVIGPLKGGQDPHQEAVAQLFACVMMALYEVDDRTGYTWKYISHYNPNPHIAVAEALSDIAKMLDYLDQLQVEIAATATKGEEEGEEALPIPA